MQAMSDETLGERAASIPRITGKGICCGCCGEIFEVIIWNDSTSEVVCIRCGQIWEALGEGQGEVGCVLKAVGNGRNVQGDVVSPEG